MKPALDVVGKVLSSDKGRENILTCLQGVVHELEISDLSSQRYIISCSVLISGYLHSFRTPCGSIN